MIATPPTDNPVDAPTRLPRPVSALLTARATLPLILLLAFVVRAVLIARAPGVLDGDEALVGIQAERIAAGVERPLPVFFYGQYYMGALEAYLAAGVFRLVGPSVAALRLVPLLFALALVALTYELARRTAGRTAARYAALLAAVPPLYVGVWSLKARGGYVETLALGTALLVVTHRLLYGPPAAGLAAVSPPPPVERFPLLLWRARSWGWWLAWGLLAGLLFWINPVSLYYTLTGAGALGVSALRRHGVREAWRWLPRARPALALVALGVLVGGLPLWIDNVARRGATFAYLLAGSGGGPGGESPIARAPRVANAFFSLVLPKFVGAWAPWGGVSLRPLDALALLLYALAGAYLLLRVAAGRRGVLRYRARPRHGQGLLLAFAVVVAVLFCLSGFGAAALNTFGFDAASRYALPLVSVLPVAAGALIWRLEHAWRPLGAAALAVLLLADGLGYVTPRPNAVFQSEYWAKLPPSEAPLVDALRARGIRDIWINHWAGYPLMFEADRRDPNALFAADYNDVALHGGVNRLPWALRRVAADPRAAYVLVTFEPHPPLEALLRDKQRVTFQRTRVGPYLVFWDLSRPVPPSAVAAGLGFSY